MTKAMLLTALAASCAAACHYGYEPSKKISGVAMVTSGPWVGEPELSRKVSDLSTRLALEICSHEDHCGRAGGLECVNTAMVRSQDELSSWDCAPAAIRARLEECLAGVPTVSCDIDLRTSARATCPGNSECGRNADLISPGRELARRLEAE
jgi:hypothetical protein